MSDEVQDNVTESQPAEAPQAPAAEETPADKPKDSEERAEPSDSEQPKLQLEPNYEGEFRPNPNVDEPIPILEEGEFAKYPSLMLSNLEFEELRELRRRVYKNIALQQPQRAELAEAGGSFYVADLPKGGQLYITEEERKILLSVNAFDESLRKGLGYKLFEDGDQWTNLPKIADTPIVSMRVAHEKSKNPIVRVRGALNLSTEITIPLWNSGMHLTVEGPGMLDQLSLETKLLLEKVESGRESSGNALAATNVFLDRHVTDFVLSFVRSSTAGTTDVYELKKLIRLTDFEPLVGMFASSIFPDGYNLERPHLKSAGGCGHVEKRKINLRRTLFVRYSRLSESQLSLMMKRSGLVDVKTIRTYQDSLRPEVSRYIDLGREGMRLKLRVPTLAEYERVAGAWMTRMQNKARELLTSNATEQERQAFLMRANSIATIMLYGHWVESVVQFKDELDTEPEVIVARSKVDESDLEAQYDADEKLDRILEDASADAELVEKIIEGIEEYINKMTLSAVAVPKINCSKCNTPVTGDEKSTHPHLVCINPVEVFFTLLHHRILIAGG